jgi:predicted lipoprotein with Yx(FWY)xxD motif
MYPPNAVGHRPRLAAIAFALAAVLAAVVAGSALAATRQHVVTTAKNATLHKRILVTRQGLTLYSLSVERKGRFICTGGACLSFWHPLLVRKGTRPTGAAHLGTVRRPGAGSRLQVTFRGAPLYTFYLDRKRGDVGGEGFKDVGTWHAASAGR